MKLCKTGMCCLYNNEQGLLFCLYLHCNWSTAKALTNCSKTIFQFGNSLSFSDCSVNKIFQNMSVNVKWNMPSVSTEFFKLQICQQVMKRWDSQMQDMSPGIGKSARAQHFYSIACAPTKTHPRSLIRVVAGHSVGSQGSKPSSDGQWRLRSTCADAQADLSIQPLHGQMSRYAALRKHGYFNILKILQSKKEQNSDKKIWYLSYSC